MAEDEKGQSEVAPSPPARNPITHDEANDSVPGAAGKPNPALYNPLIEDLLDKECDRRRRRFRLECPMCLEDACRKQERATEGFLLDEESADRLGSALAFDEVQLQLDLYRNPTYGEFALYWCLRCSRSGAHFRLLRDQYEAAEVTE